MTGIRATPLQPGLLGRPRRSQRAPRTAALSPASLAERTLAGSQAAATGGGGGDPAAGTRRGAAGGRRGHTGR